MISLQAIYLADGKVWHGIRLEVRTGHHPVGGDYSYVVVTGEAEPAYVLGNGSAIGEKLSKMKLIEV